MDKMNTGAWVIHHGRKVSFDVRGGAEYSAIDFSAKTAGLLSRLSENSQITLSLDQVVAAALVGNLNPKSELESCLLTLKEMRLIDRSKDGSVSVLGVIGQGVVSHAADLFESSSPSLIEKAAIELADLASDKPISSKGAIEYISDNYKMPIDDTSEFINKASQIGFVDAEGDGADRILFNGNLFRRDNASKAMKVIDSLNSHEQSKLTEFEELLKIRGATTSTEAISMLGDKLYQKVQAAALYDMNVVSNESGDYTFVTSPGSFHKFSNPLVEDVFDHAKALVAALTYGMTHSPFSRGHIWGVDLLLSKLIRGESVGPATAIGNDYRALELEKVVKTEKSGNSFRMRLLKRDVGIIALEVLKGKNAAVSALETLPSAGMRGYAGPETTRMNFRKMQSSMSRAQTQSILNAVRGVNSL